MSNLVLRGYKSGLKIVPTIPRYDNSGNEINDASYWPVPIDEIFRTNYGFNIYTGSGTLPPAVLRPSPGHVHRRLKQKAPARAGASFTA